MKKALMLAVVVVLSFGYTLGFAQPNEIILSQNAESESLPNSIFPNNTMIQAIFASYDRDERAMYKRMLKDCTSRKKVPLRKLFRAMPLPKIGNQDTVYFVRPAVEPFCLGFYGAHIFQFWLVSKNDKVLYSGGADGVTIFKTSHNGMYDLELEHGGGWGISQTQLEFDGHEYKPTVCTETRLDEKGKESTGRVSCSREF